MRTALILLFLLALGSVPGSVLPQQGINPQAVQQYYAAHPLAGARCWPGCRCSTCSPRPGSPRSTCCCSLSLAGCVIPRTFRLAGSARAAAAAGAAQPVPAAAHGSVTRPRSPRTRRSRPRPAVLSAKRFRLRTGDGWMSAEKGYLREAGNLLFHLALLGAARRGRPGRPVRLQGQPAAGGRATRSPTPSPRWTQFHPGRLVSAADLQPFTIALDHVPARPTSPRAPCAGQPSRFDALHPLLGRSPGPPARSYDLRVNHPLNVDGVRVFLIGHGYAPVFRVTDGTGRVVFDGPVPFIPVEQTGLTSEGVIKVPDAHPQQLGFAGVFLPTAVDVSGKLESAFPAPLHPVVSLVSYAGNLGMNSGPSQSVYQLDTAGLHRLPVAPQPAGPGPVDEAPGRRRARSPSPATGSGSAWPSPTTRAAARADRRDRGPGRPAPVLPGPAPPGVRPGHGRAADGSTVVEVGGLARTDAAGGFEAEFASLAGEISAAQQARAGHPGRDGTSYRSGPPARRSGTRPPISTDREGVRPVPVNVGLANLSDHSCWPRSCSTRWPCWPSPATSPSGRPRASARPQGRPQEPERPGPASGEPGPRGRRSRRAGRPPGTCAAAPARAGGAAGAGAVPAAGPRRRPAATVAGARTGPLGAGGASP